MWKSFIGTCGSHLKLSSRCKRKERLYRYFQKTSIQCYSSLPPSSRSSSSTNIIIGVAGTTILIAGGTVIAAKFNPRFRSLIEERVPYSNYVFSAVIGEEEKDDMLTVLSKQEQAQLRSSRQTYELPAFSKKSTTSSSTETKATSEAKISESKPIESVSVVKKEGHEVVTSDNISVPSPPLPTTDFIDVSGSEDRKSPSDKTTADVTTVKEESVEHKEEIAEVPLAIKLQNQVEQEMKRQEEEIEKNYQEKKEYKEELLKQLRRQAVFHSEYLRALLQAQRNELKSEFEDLFQDKISEVKHKMQEDLASYYAQLTGVKEGLYGYVDSHNKWTAAKKLWIACLALKRHCDPIKSVGSDSEFRQPLAPVMDFLNTAGSEDKFIGLVVQAIPEDAIKSGVYSKEVLMERFYKLENMCRRVALIGDSGGSLYKYALSYLQSQLIRSRNLFRTTKVTDEPVDVSQYDVFDILDHAKWYILQGNLETAVRYINLLHGTPRKVARDWLKDARTYLEVNQVADLLIARSGATDILNV